MGVITKNLDSRPYVGKRRKSGKVRVKTSEEAAWLDSFFNGTPNCEQVTDITRGKVYDVVCVEGFGDVEDITIIDDSGNEQVLGSFFFDEVE